MNFYLHHTSLFRPFKFVTFRTVFFSKKPKPRERFYLLPGQGGRNYHRKQAVIMRWTIAVAILFGLILAAAMWWFSKPRL